MTLYELLEVSADCDFAALKKAYYRKARKCHPDLFSNSPEKTEEFRRLVEAFNILSDPERRTAYNRSIQAAAVDLRIRTDGIMDTDSDDTLEELMAAGPIFAEKLGEDYYPLALYLIRQARNIPDGKKYTSSRNMEKPKVEYTYVLTPTQLRVPAGATTLPGTRYEPELGVNFVRYIPREKDPARKIGGRKEMAVACAGEEGEEAEA